MAKATAGVMEAQRVLQSTDVHLKVDGQWGPKTNRAYDRASSDDKLLVKGILSRYGVDIGELMPSYAATRDMVMAALDRAANASGVSLHILTVMARTESGFNPNAVNGNSRGLMQFQPAAWAQAAQRVALPPYSMGWYDPYASALAAAALMSENIEALQRLHFTDPIDAAVIYLAHQQGAAGLVELWNASRGIFNTKYVSVDHMTRNPPPDGGTPTTDKAAFYTRWLAVMRKRFE